MTAESVYRRYALSSKSLTICLACLLGDYFIGLNDEATEGTFQWVDGTDALYTNWKHKNGPQNDENKNCVRIRMQNGNGNNHGKWEIHKCENSSGFICECPEGPCT